MARGGVKLAFVTNSKTRRGSYQKKTQGLMKKVTELSVLCDIDVCAIVYNPTDSQAEVWPNPRGVQHVIERFRNLPEREQHKKMLDQETFLRQRICKLNEQLSNKYKENRQKEMMDVMYQILADKNKNWLQNLIPEDKTDLQSIIDQKLNEVTKRLEAFKSGASDHHKVAPALAPALAPSPEPAIPSTIFEMPPTGETLGQGLDVINPLAPVTVPRQELMIPMAPASGEWKHDSFANKELCNEKMMPFNDNRT